MGKYYNVSALLLFTVEIHINDIIMFYYCVLLLCIMYFLLNVFLCFCVCSLFKFLCVIVLLLLAKYRHLVVRKTFGSCATTDFVE